MLVLFDIDATLLTTRRAGVEAMAQAGAELFGEGFRGDVCDYAGRLDPLIFHDLLVHHGHEPSETNFARFRERYAQILRDMLAEPGRSRACPGALDLVASLAAHAQRDRDALALGLLTGNFPETGALKLTAAGYDMEHFTVRVWGCDSPHSPPARDHLPAVAFERHREQLGRAIDPARVVIIGDTPHDIACARAHGCRSLGVGTGLFTPDQLLAAGATHAVKDLADTRAMQDWLLDGAPETV